MINKEALRLGALNFGVALDETALDRFDKYASLLCEWNKFMNLTAIKEPEEIVNKHFIDSLSLLSAVKIPENAKIIDVGTGAGFPGIPVLIARNDLKVTLLDSTNKRLEFIKAVLEETGLSAETVHMRAEDAGRDENYREKFDFATARAVSNLRELSEYCLPFVKKNGYFVPMKSAKTDEEIKEAEKAIKTLGGKTEKVISFEIDGAGTRTVILIKKISQTSSAYPRPSAKMAKFPII